MTSGTVLKKNLGLDKLKYVRISRAIGYPVKILFVWYDSYRSDMPITNYRVRKFPWTATMFVGARIMQGSNRKATFTPLMDIEDYNGEVRNAAIIPVNLAGDRFIDKKHYTKQFESVEDLESTLLGQYNQTFLEFVTLKDLADRSAISDFTMTWRNDRNRVMGTENTTAKLIDCFVDEADKSVTFAFLTESTELGDKKPNPKIDSPYRFYSGPKGEVDPENQFNIKRNPSKTYELQIKVLDILGDEGWLSTFEGETITRKEMKEILEVSNVQVFSTSPAFHWQGANFNLSQLDGSIHPTNISNPIWGPRHGDKDGYFVGKHLYGLLKQMGFWLNPMASTLTKKLKDRGLI